jgi:hypothetical protein
MNIEQGRSKEEGRGLSTELATKSAKNHKAARGGNQSELPLEHDWFTFRWSLNSCRSFTRL